MPSDICSNNSSFHCFLVKFVMYCFSETAPVEEVRIFCQDTKRIEIEPFVILNSLDCPWYGLCVCVCVCCMSGRESEREG